MSAVAASPAEGGALPGGGPDPVLALSKVLDAGALQRLRELDPSGAAQLLPRVLQAFDSSLQRLLQQLEAARGGPDLAAIRHVSHTLKSSAASIGALELSALCAEVERRAREGSAEGMPELLDRMVDESARVSAALAPVLQP